MMFSIAYWWIDRGGAESRVSGVQQMPDWRFPREDEDDGALRPWQPSCRLPVPCLLHRYFLRSHRSHAHDPARQIVDDGGKSHLAGDRPGDRFARHRRWAINIKCPPSGTFSRCGRTPTPTSPSISKPKPSTRSYSGEGFRHSRSFRIPHTALLSPRRVSRKFASA